MVPGAVMKIMTSRRKLSSENLKRRVGPPGRHAERGAPSGTASSAAHIQAPPCYVASRNRRQKRSRAAAARNGRAVPPLP